mgnify:CR=1 FL=1
MNRYQVYCKNRVHRSVPAGTYREIPRPRQTPVPPEKPESRRQGLKDAAGNSLNLRLMSHQV